MLVLLVLALIPLGAIFLVTRSWFIVDRVEPVLERLLGGEVEIGRARYRGEGLFVFSDVALRAEGVAGPGGEACRVGAMEVKVDPDRLLRGEIRVLDVEVTRVRVRISERENAPGTFNFMELRPDWAQFDRSSAFLPPQVQIRSAVVEVGSHDNARYRATGRRTLSGSMRPRPDEEGWYTVTAIEVDSRGEVLERDALLVDGRWNVRTNEHAFHVKEVELSDRARGMCPNIALVWWDEMNLSGRVAGVDIHWSPVDGFRVRFDVDEVGLTLPIDTSKFWARYRDGAVEASRRRARMRVDKGTIELTPTSVTLDDIEGEFVSSEEADDVVGVPYQVTVRITDIPEVDWSDKKRWMDEVLATAPFEMQFRAENFRVERDGDAAPPAVELPLAVAQALEKFSFSDWVLSTEIAISRDAPQRDDAGVMQAGEIRSRGKAFITQGVGRYDKFPYPLHDVEAYLQFEDELVTVHNILGHGSGDATVRLSGSIRSGDDSTIALKLVARDVPVDEVLFDALNQGQKHIYRSLLHTPSFTALSEAGFIADGPEAFALGGVVDLDLNIEKRAKAEARTRTSGLVTIQSLGLLFDRFPYPVRVLGGQIDWQPERISIVEGPDGGLPIATPGGGRGTLSGHIDVERKADGKLVARPALAVAVHGDTISDTLYAAIPPTRAEREQPEIAAGWPGRALSRGGRGLAQLSLGGVLSYRGEFQNDADEQLQYRIAVDLEDGSALPAESIAGMLGRDVRPDPGSWRLDECRGRLVVTREGVKLEDFTGRLGIAGGFARVGVDGRIDTTREAVDARLDVDLGEVPLCPELLDLLPRGPAERVAALWDRYEPEGSFDAGLAYRRSGEEPPALEITLVPNRVSAHLGDDPVSFTRQDGQLRLVPDRVHFDDLVLAVDDGTGVESLIELGDSFDLAPDLQDRGGPVTGRWLGAELASPIIREAVRQFVGEEYADRFTSYEPAGRLDATFTYQPPGAAQPREYELRIVPRRVDFVLGETAVVLEFDDGAEAVFRPGVVDLVDLHARHDSGVIDTRGTIRFSPRLDVDLDLGYRGRLMSAEVAAFLPAPVRQALEAIELQEGGPSTLEDGRFRFVAGDEVAGAAGASYAFDGEFAFVDASVTAGVPFEEISGPFSLSVSRAPEQGLKMEIDGRPTRLTALGQQLHDVEGFLRLSEDGTVVRLESFRADAPTGAISATAKIGVAANRDYSVAIQVADVPVHDFKVAPAASDGSEVEGPSNAGGLYANVTLSGRRGEPESRVGRGVVRMMEEGLAGIPLAVRLLQPFHATLPVGEWDYGDAVFFIDGDMLVFERLLFESSFEGMFVQHLEGEGTMSLPGFVLDTRFRSRGGVLLVRDLIGGIGDQIASLEVTGPLWDPQVRVIALPGLQRPKSVAAAPAEEPEE